MFYGMQGDFVVKSPTQWSLQFHGPKATYRGILSLTNSEDRSFIYEIRLDEAITVMMNEQEGDLDDGQSQSQVRDGCPLNQSLSHFSMKSAISDG